MSQFDMPTIDPTINTGTQLSAWLNSWQEALETSHAGPAIPPYVKAGMVWVHQTSATQWELMWFDGVHNIPIIVVDPTTGVPTPPAIGTRPKFDSTTAPANTDFVQKALGNFNAGVQVGAAKVLVPEEMGRFIQLSGPDYVVTLPAIAAGALGTTITVVNNSLAPKTIQAAGADIITTGTTYAATLRLGPGDSVALACANAASWYAYAGSVATRNSNDFGASIAVQGYQKFASGIIIQWGEMTQNDTGAPAGYAWTYPIAFPNIGLQGFIVPANAIATPQSVSCETMAVPSMQGFTIGPAGARKYRLFAIGY